MGTIIRSNNEVNRMINDGELLDETSGQALIDASIAEIPSAETFGYENFIINGGYQIQQYDDIDSAPVAMTIFDAYIDGWKAYHSVASTIQRFAYQVVDGASVSTLKVVATADAYSNTGLYQKLENFHKNETVTMSAWVKSNSTNARLLLSDTAAYTSSTAHTGGGAWELLTVTKTISASTTKLEAFTKICSAAHGSVTITTGDYMEIAMVKLERGSIATGFIQQKYEADLRECQRFVPFYLKPGGTYDIYCMGIAASTSSATLFLPIKAVPYKIPTVIEFLDLQIRGSDTGTRLDVTAIALSSWSPNENYIVLTCSATGVTYGDTYMLCNSTTSAAGYLRIKGEI